MKYPHAFRKWYSSNIGGVRLPMNNKTGRPIGDNIIEGKIHGLIKEMIDAFKLNKGKCLCVLVGGPGNGKTDLMEYAAELFFEVFDIDKNVGKVNLQEGFKLNNRNYLHKIKKCNGFKKCLDIENFRILLKIKNNSSLIIKLKF